jgi:hypothetical protein
MCVAHPSIQDSVIWDGKLADNSGHGIPPAPGSCNKIILDIVPSEKNHLALTASTLKEEHFLP